jgi:hypothetical protein
LWVFLWRRHWHGDRSGWELRLRARYTDADTSGFEWWFF